MLAHLYIITIKHAHLHTCLGAVQVLCNRTRGEGGVCKNMILYDTGGRGGRPKYDVVLCRGRGESIGTSGWRCSRSPLGGRLATTIVDRYFHHYFLLPSSVPVGKFSASWTETSPIITVSPTHPATHLGKYILATSRLPLVLKIGMEALFNHARSTSQLASHQLVSQKCRG